MVPFKASEGILAQKMVTLASTIALLQMMAILPQMGICRTCKVPTPKWKEENWIFWECGTCTSSSGRTGIRANTVLEKSNLKLERFVMLLWNFAERGKTYEQISTAANLPTQAHYVDDELSQSCKKHFNSTDTYLDYCTGANSTDPDDRSLHTNKIEGFWYKVEKCKE